MINATKRPLLLLFALVGPVTQLSYRFHNFASKSSMIDFRNNQALAPMKQKKKKNLQDDIGKTALFESPAVVEIYCSWIAQCSYP